MDDFPPRRRAGDPSTGRSGTALRSQPERVRPEEEIRARTRKDAPRLRGLRSTAIHGNIEIRGARQDNLRDVSLDIPKGKITVFTGVSGSGKSSLVSGTIAAESQRLVNETYTAFLQGLMPHYGQPDADSLRNLSAAIVVDQKRLGGTSRSTVGTVTDTYAMLRLLFARVGTPHVGPAHLFSFNDPRACAASARAWAAARPSTWTSWSTAAVFDEPGVGLHPHDVHRLNDLLGQLCDKGNTVLVVEHRPTAIEIADAEGLASLSMRRVAEHLSAGTMSLYTYVPGKSELIDLLLDTVYAETARPADLPGGWRARLEQVARENWQLYRRHPWMLQVGTIRPPLGPNAALKYEYELNTVAGIGLSEIEMDSVVALVIGHAEGAARRAYEAASAERDTGMTDAQWWQAISGMLTKVIDASRFPTAAAVGEKVGETYGTAHDPAHNFEFGLQRILDGIEVFVQRER